MGRNKSILIVDDHPLFREGLRARILRDAEFQVVEEAGTGFEALRKAKELKPDLVVVDISLPDQNGIQLIREIQSALPETRIMIVSMYSEIDYVLDALHAGAIGYVVKGSASERLMEGLEAVARGDHFLDSSLSSEIAKKLMELPQEGADPPDSAYETLTQRQQEVLRLLAAGFSNKRIADVLCISPKTVENHRSQIMEKLGLGNSVELGQYAARLPLIGSGLCKG
jgi:DNA-binding NarL/FixJ family response regulator